jgi:hypothetical protein
MRNDVQRVCNALENLTADVVEKNGGDDGTRARGLCRDSSLAISTFNDLQEHGRHPKAS